MNTSHAYLKWNKQNTYAACSFRWFIVLKALFAGLLWEKNTARWLLILLISPNEHGDEF
jgi:hypothetical protein